MPKIDVSSLPGLDTAMGLFGSISSTETSAGGPIVEIMVYLYETAPPPPPPPPGLFF